MDSLLDALQEGRLIELPDNNKEHALQYLAHIIEAIPSLPTGADVVGLVMEREHSTNTALGRGWACPHARVSFDEDLLCVVGWSPTGIDYGAPDGVPVTIIAMYLVPENQRNRYLREVSVLAKALLANSGIEGLQAAKELNEIRDQLLDLISSAKATAGPDTRARMIQLQQRHTVPASPVVDWTNLVVEPVSIVAGPGLNQIILSQNPKLMECLDAAPGLSDAIASHGVFQQGAWRIVKRAGVTYQGGRVLYECLAIGTAGGDA